MSDPRQPTPPLPPDVLLQVHLPEPRTLWRIAEDGRFLVTPPDGPERQERPLSKLERGQATVSPRGLQRLRDVLDEVGFFDLPEEIAASDDTPEGAALPNTAVGLARRPVIFSARAGDAVRTVEIHADLRAPGTLGVLGPVYEALDLEALGNWMKE